MEVIDLQFALNHMAFPRLGYAALIHTAAKLGCVGVEFRNDFAGRTLFEGDAPETVKAVAEAAGIRVLGLSEVKMFNRWSEAKAKEAEALLRIAVAIGSPTVSLIPANDGQGLGNGERQANLRLALRELAPMLAEFGLVGLVEPLGFPSSSVRNKSETIEMIEAVSDGSRFRIIHDTFHHALAGGGALFPDYTAIVHISGVTNQRPALEALQDTHRVLVEPVDRVQNIEQILGFRTAGWNGPFSFEPFSPEFHSISNPAEKLAGSMEYIRTEVTMNVA